MKIILSRKGFDSSYGGVPSVIREDGKMISAPIPEMNGKGHFFDTGTRYGDLSDFTLPAGCKYGLDVFCHLDPDIRPELHKQLPSEWKPILGQSGAAARHLDNHHIEEGDLFLFWGWFRKADEPRPFHAVWGYMQIAEIVKDSRKIREYAWHPHGKACYCEKHGAQMKDTNTLYVGADTLSGIAGAEGIPGYGTFRFDDASRPLLKLTRDGDSCPTHWRADSLPWLDWKNCRANMTYHDGDAGKACFGRDGSYFQAACRGQEFIVDHVDEKTLAWLRQLLECRNTI